MGLTIRPSGPVRFGGGTGKEPIEGVWQPKKYQEQQAAQQAQREKAAKDRQNLLKIIAIVVMITIFSIIVPFMMPGNAGCDTCFVTTFIVLVMMGIFLWIFYAATGVDQAAQANIPYFYPVIQINFGKVLLDGVPVDYNNVAVCQLDRVLDEFRIVATDWKRRVIYLKYYENPDVLAEALKRNFEANGKAVELRGVEGQMPAVPGEAPQAREAPRPKAKKEDVWAVEPISDEEYQAEVEKNIAEVAPEAPRALSEPPMVTEPLELDEPPEVPIEPLPKPVAVQPVDDTPRCRNCGAELSEDLIECPSCGTAI